MTKAEFQAWPYLLTPGQVAACGYSPATIHKYVEHEILRAVLPRGIAQRRFQKVQIARLLGWEDVLDRERWQREKPLLPYCAVREWTGYDPRSIKLIVRAGGLVAVNPGGIGDAKYRKEQIGEWIGL